MEAIYTMYETVQSVQCKLHRIKKQTNYEKTN